MVFFDHAWTLTLQITKKNHEDVKVLLREKITYPKLRIDNYGYVLYIPAPRKTGNNTVTYQGMRLNLDDDHHKRVLWQMFKASTYHLSAHVVVSNYNHYRKWIRHKNIENAMFAICITEDAIANAYLKAKWNFLIPEIAIANAISYLRLKPASHIRKEPLILRAAILSEGIAGKVKGIKIKREIIETAEKISKMLKELENKAYESFKMAEKSEETEKILEALIDKKIGVADSIYNILSRFDETSQIPSLPYTDNHGKNSLFYKKVPEEESIMKIAKKAYQILEPEKGEPDTKIFIETFYKDDISQIFSNWKSSQERKNKIIAKYKELGKDTKFLAYEFPEEDYTEYLRRRMLLGSPIRRILEKLRLIRNVTGEDFRQEAGLVDLQEAIQVIASKSQRTDIFVREELQTREDRWVILVDASRSLKFFTGEVRDIALCLAEVAKNLIINQNAWAMYAFNNRFYIIKDFSETFSSKVKARIGGLKHGGMSYIPDAIKIAFEALKGHIEESKVIVVVSDFFPSGYEEIESELAQMVKKLERLGIGMLGIGVKSRAVKKFFRFSCVVEEPYELMKKFTKAFIEYSSV
ncbi:VWA domain-containing protein [Candidatus Bathyarchaeota archaeon]|nr:VWA domain-containing protein [Candidatus Bathyarchaeota archaeon]